MADLHATLAKRITEETGLAAWVVPPREGLSGGVVVQVGERRLVVEAREIAGHVASHRVFERDGEFGVDDFPALRRYLEGAARAVQRSGQSGP